MDEERSESNGPDAERGEQRDQVGDEQGAFAPLFSSVDPGPLGALLTAAVFLAGLLFGWLALGWWLFPVEWTDALPADLRADARTEYVRMVADLYVRDNDVERARRRLQSFESTEGDLVSVAPIITALRSNAESDTIGAQNAEQLARGLQIAPLAEVPADAAGTESGPSASAESDGAEDEPSSQWLRTVALGVLIGGAGAGLALAWAWSAWRTGAASTSARRRRSGRSEHDPSGALDNNEGPELDSDTTAFSDPDPGLAASAEESSVPEREVARRRGRTEVLSFSSAERRGSRGSSNSSPTRIKLGETTTLDYVAADEPFRWSWLVHDERDRLVATAVIEEKRIGTVNALELAFYEKLAAGGDELPSSVSIVARSAADNFLLANDLLKDRILAPALSGDVVTLTTDDYSVDIEIRDVVPDPQVSDVMELTSLTLALTPFRRSEEQDDERIPRYRLE